jgi:hypothetical protein
MRVALTGAGHEQGHRPDVLPHPLLSLIGVAALDRPGDPAVGAQHAIVHAARAARVEPHGIWSSGWPIEPVSREFAEPAAIMAWNC